MTPRHIALVAGAALVLGLGVYLYVAVQSTSPAVANVSPDDKPHPGDRDEHAAKTPAREHAPKDHGRTAESRAATDTARGDSARGSADVDPLDKNAVMASANRAYDLGDFDEAIVIAKRVLSGDAQNTRMLRIMVSASCILGDTATAQHNYLLLPHGGQDRADMKRRCDQYGIAFTET